MSSNEKRDSFTTIESGFAEVWGGRKSMTEGCMSTTTTTDDHTMTPPTHLLPDGSLRPRIAVLGAFLGLLCTFGHMNAFGTYQSWYSVHQLKHLPMSTIAWIGSLQLFVFFMSGGIIGQIYDAYGPRWLLATGTFCYVLSIMMMSISTQFYQYILAQGLLFGLGVGLVFYPCMACVSTHFTEYRATALGIVAAGSSLGGVMYPMMLQTLFDRVGFGWGARISGLLSGVCCIITILTVSLPFTQPSAEERTKTVPNAVSAMKDPKFVLLAIGSMLVALGIFIPFFYISDYTISLALPSSTSPSPFVVLAALNAGSVFGRIAPAYLSDSIGCFNILAPSALLSGFLCIISWLFAHNAASLMVFAVLYGFTSGAFISVVTPCVVQISDMRMVGRRIGLLYSIIAFPSLVGGPAAGELLARANGSYVPMIAFAGATVMVGSIFIFMARFLVDSRVLVRV